jgi:hypothetical protein
MLLQYNTILLRPEDRCKTKQKKQTNKLTPWPLVRERSIPTERPPLVDEI